MKDDKETFTDHAAARFKDLRRKHDKAQVFNLLLSIFN